MKSISGLTLMAVSGGDRWCDTPEGRSTVDGAPGPTSGTPQEACQSLAVRLNGKEVEICVVARKKN